VPPGENRIAANAELHPVFDFFVHRHRFFPIDFGILAEHDCSDERICAVGWLDTAGSQVGFALKLLAALTVVKLPTWGQLSDELFIVRDDDLPALDELPNRRPPFGA
jgi:hypothetical protein